MNYLKILSDQGSAHAQVALALLGEEEYFAQIVSQTERDKPYFTRFQGVEKLFLMNADKRSMKRLSDLLNDTEKAPSERDSIIYPISDTIIIKLAKIVENPPRLPNGNLDYSVPAWKAWFAKNKHLIE